MPEVRTRNDRDGLAAAGLGAGFFVLYGLTLCRTVFWYDSAELVTAAVTLGVTHPPGYPLYTLIGHLFTWLPLDPATAVNLMSASFAALAVGLVFLVVRQLGLDRVPAVIGAATLGASRLFWSNALVAEVYCPAVAVSALVLHLLLRASNEKRSSLAVGLHLSIATLGLGFALLVWRNGRRMSRLFAAAGATFAGSLIFLYVPLRASQEPPLNLCNPSSLGQFAWYLSGGAYRHWFGAQSSVLERSMAIGGFFHDQLGWVGLAFALAGMAWLSRQRASECIALFLMATGNIAFFFGYQAHDVEVFLLPTTMILCCFVGAGAQGLVDVTAKLVGPAKARLATQIASSALLLFPLQLAYSNFASVDMSGFDETEPFIRATVDTLAQDAVILNFTTPPEWKRYAVFGMYAQLVKGERPDVKHAVAPDLRELARTFDPKAATYAYAPVPVLAHFFELEAEGPLFRVLAAKPMAATQAPRGRKRHTRTCWQP
jgi:Protein of unknown function (DUF2723)